MNEQEDKNLADFQMKDYVFTELRFNIYSQNFDEEKEEPANLYFDVKTKLLDDLEKVDRGEVTLSININADEARKGNASFDMTAVMNGLFTTSSKVSRTIMENYLKSDGIAALFPFLRSTIAELGRMSNEKRLPTLILPLINVSAFVDNE